MSTRLVVVFSFFLTGRIPAAGLGLPGHVALSQNGLKFPRATQLPTEK